MIEHGFAFPYLLIIILALLLLDLITALWWRR